MSKEKDDSLMDNEKYNLPCPYNQKVLCVQIPCDPNDDNYCDDGCPESEGNLR